MSASCWCRDLKRARRSNFAVKREGGGIAKVALVVTVGFWRGTALVKKSSYDMRKAFQTEV